MGELVQINNINVADIIAVEANAVELVPADTDNPVTLRNYNGSDVDALAVYKSLWRRFADDIINSNYKVFPTRTEFRRWMIRQVGRSSKQLSADCEIYIDRYITGCADWVKLLQADIISQGSAAKKYERSAAIFALKNLCGWTDSAKQESASAGPIQINISVV